MTHVIEAEALVKRFGTTTAPAGIELKAERGTVLGLLGPNGSGKMIGRSQVLEQAFVLTVHRSHQPCRRAACPGP